MSDNKKAVQVAAMWKTNSGKFYLKAGRDIKKGESIYFLKNKIKTTNQPDWLAFEYKDQLDNNNKKEV